MPLLRFDVLEGRSRDQITSLLDAAHRAMLSAFNVPPRDRYQILHEHAASHFVVQDTGLNIARTHNVVVVASPPGRAARKKRRSFTWSFAAN